MEEEEDGGGGGTGTCRPTLVHLHPLFVPLPVLILFSISGDGLVEQIVGGGVIPSLAEKALPASYACLSRRNSGFIYFMPLVFIYSYIIYYAIVLLTLPSSGQKKEKACFVSFSFWNL